MKKIKRQVHYVWFHVAIFKDKVITQICSIWSMAVHGIDNNLLISGSSHHIEQFEKQLNNQCSDCFYSLVVVMFLSKLYKYYWNHLSRYFEAYSRNPLLKVSLKYRYTNGLQIILINSVYAIPRPTKGDLTAITIPIGTNDRMNIAVMVANILSVFVCRALRDFCSVMVLAVDEVGLKNKYIEIKYIINSQCIF